MSRPGVRAVVSAIGLVIAGGAVVALVARSYPTALGLAIWATLLLGGLAIERWRYKRLGATPPGAGWQATDERFVDPETGRLVTVYFNAATGERRYVAA